MILPRKLLQHLSIKISQNVQQPDSTYNNTVIPSKYCQLTESSHQIPTSSNISSNKEGKRSAIRRQTSGRRSLPEVKKGTVNSCQDSKRRWFVSVQPITAPCARLKQRHDWPSASPQLLQMMRMPGGARWSLGPSTAMPQKLVRLSLPARAP